MAFKDDFPTSGGGGGKNPFDDEELQRKLASAGFKIAIILPVVIIALWGLFTSYYTIEPEKRGVVLRFGSFQSISEPGLHFKIPFGVDTVEYVDAPTRVLKEEFGFRTVQAGENTQYSGQDFSIESLMLTGDLNVIEVEWVVQYTIEDARKYLFNVRDPVRTLRDVSEAVMRRIVGNRLGSDVLTRGRVEIANNARDEIQKILDILESGLRVSTVELQDVVPPPRVKPAFNEVNIARQERERMINEAERRRNEQIPRVQGQAKQRIASAEGYAVERVNRAKGEVARFNAILKEYQNAPEVTRRRLYLETIGQVLPNVERIVVIPENGAAGPLPLLNLDQPRRGGSQ